MIPRTNRLVEVPRNKSKGEGDSFRLSVNGFLVMGYWYAGNEDEGEDLKSLGLGNVLRDCGYSNPNWKGPK